MHTTRVTVLAAAILALTGWAFAAGETTKAEPKAPAKPASAKQIDRWVQDMDADSAAVRDRAVKRLIEAGAAVIGPVARAAKGKSLEVTVRSVSVLEALLKSADKDTAAAARAALTKLAADQSHPAGQEAKRALSEPKRRVRAMNGVVFGQMVAQVRVGAAGGGMRVTLRNANGRKDVDVDDNGRKIHITEDKNGIVVKVQEKAEGKKKPKAKEYKAANAAELKKKHPEAYKLYEKYGKQKGANLVLNLGNVRVGAVPGGAIMPVKAVAERPVARPRIDVRKAARLIDKARAELKAAIEKLKAGGKDAPDAKALAELVKRIEAAEAGLAEARKSLPR